LTDRVGSENKQTNKQTKSRSFIATHMSWS
jgi:hypothetical protein